MNRLLTFHSIEEGDFARLEDMDGNAVALPRKWLPKQAQLGQVLHAVCVSSDEVSSLFIEVDAPWSKE